MADIFPVMMGDCGCVNCGAGDFTIGEMTYGDETFAPAAGNGNILAQDGPADFLAYKFLNGGAALPRGSYFIKYCGGYYTQSSNAVISATQGVNLLIRNPATLQEPGYNIFNNGTALVQFYDIFQFPRAFVGVASVDSIAKLQATEGCLGIGFYNPTDNIAPNIAFLAQRVNETTGIPVYPKFRIYEYKAMMTLSEAKFYMDSSGSNPAATINGVPYFNVAHFFLYNPSRGPWILNGTLRISGGVGQSSTLPYTFQSRTVTKIDVYYNTNPGTKYDSTLTLVLTDGLNVNPDIVVPLKPVITASVFNSTFGGASGAQNGNISFQLINSGYGQINGGTATISGAGITTQSKAWSIAGYGANLSAAPKLIPAYFSEFLSFTYQTNATTKPASITLQLTSPGANWGTFTLSP